MNTGEREKMNVKQPTKFTVKLSNCGIDTCAGSYKKFEENNALTLLFNTQRLMAKDFVRQDNLNLQYDLACMILGSLTGWDKESLLKDIETLKEKENRKAWQIVSNIEEKRTSLTK